MKLTEEQLVQCREEFEADWRKLTCYGESAAKEIARKLYQAAWRPIPSEEDIETIIFDNICADKMLSISNKVIKMAACAVHRAFGGKDDK